MSNYKRILDSVHGYINVPKEYCDKIIDTVYFQRLRRIEQTSGRSLFPSARHDRFIHFLGVFNLGQKIVESIKRRYPNGFTDHDQQVYDSYVIACLLHDVCHSPFSHTFENYYALGNDLRGLLTAALNDEGFTDDWEVSFSNAAPHEIMSALLVVKEFRSWIETEAHADIKLIVRMIIGCKYMTNKKHKSFENAFIDLIHGDIIDADGLDYACRDAWASGYCTSKIDVDRLIDSISIEKDVEGQFLICYTAKALNEIEAVLNVKSFQQTNVITHHTVVYEQYLLVKAMESAALFHIDGKENVEDANERTSALKKLCNFDSFEHPIQLQNSKVNLVYPMDDDFVSLMKYIPNDKYVKQWLSRQYDLKPLWKSKAEFFHLFPMLIDKKYTDKNWLFSDACQKYISEEFGIASSSIWIIPATSKYKGNLASKVHLYVNGKIHLYTDLFKGDKNSFIPNQLPFSYIYVPKDYDVSAIVAKLNEKIKSFIFS